MKDNDRENVCEDKKEVGVNDLCSEERIMWRLMKIG